MEIEEIEDSDRSITCEYPSEVIIQIEAILRLGALPVCEFDESLINVGFCRRWHGAQLILLSLEEIDKIEPVSEALFTESIGRVRSNSESGIVVTSDTDAGARACGNIGRINVHSNDCSGEKTSAIVSSDRFCVLRVIDGTARPDLDGSIVPGDRNSFCSAPADSPRAIETHRGRSPP